jgi:murein DD-endopeptidase MepM/ murein hydrolase activator NlpD
VIDTRPLSIAETFGLSPLSQRAREAWLTLRGDPSTPPSRFDHTSLRMFKPRMALPLWRGRPAHGRLIPIYNLVSHVRPPPEEGWSVRVTFARDFLGTQLTYDSHNGTDFAVPLGTVVLAAAAGTVLRVSREFDRGGLKVFIDHGDGLVTTSNHLGRAFVRVGQRVRRGEPIALSAYSGLDGLSTFPFGAPHVHYNVWLNGEYVDPFGLGDTIPLWRNGNWPIPHRGDGRRRRAPHALGPRRRRAHPRGVHPRQRPRRHHLGREPRGPGDERALSDPLLPHALLRAAVPLHRALAAHPAPRPALSRRGLRRDLVPPRRRAAAVIPSAAW